MSNDLKIKLLQEHLEPVPEKEILGSSTIPTIPTSNIKTIKTIKNANYGKVTRSSFYYVNLKNYFPRGYKTHTLKITTQDVRKSLCLPLLTEFKGLKTGS